MQEIEARHRGRTLAGTAGASASSPEIIVDGAHNPAGARALAAYIDRFYAGRNVTLIFGAMRDKAIDEIGGILFPARPPGDPDRARPASRCRARRHPHAGGSLRCARHAIASSSAGADPRFAGEDVVFITGSLFLVAEARALVPVIIESNR